MSSVDLPAPFSPHSPRISPGRAARSAPAQRVDAAEGLLDREELEGGDADMSSRERRAQTSRAMSSAGTERNIAMASGGIPRSVTIRLQRHAPTNGTCEPSGTPLLPLLAPPSAPGRRVRRPAAA